ncbi:hypothetical protein SARC_07254 [Sphaeroforma arctica JP610]|uniref:Glycosyl transferase 64 domain-containing protein n=1 Tax=Sphaeroforma arctica JP610 TaxID=667725 RepID=A0A0L0FU82_9EUKA|nr:hypothetical protein SARC_07254 [Sphaeroforma arctica JP610]KNC80387.1 hypothetical protein SARC_07254 [Sphaeroforma arctica JP610]|eukprot:XP_014154289.1 hypothetical protein SARC_07254 [Sphaeroforma arctica JP610]
MLRIEHTEPIQKSEVNKAGNGKKDMKKVGPLYMPRKDPCTHPKTPSALSKTKYTLLMLIHGKCKWKQLVYDLTLESMKRLDQVVLLWNNDWLPPKELLEVRIREGGPRVVIIKMAHNSMNNRFMPWSPIRTAAVYILDMDIRLPGEALEFAFDNWLQHQGSIVGYAYRRFYANGTYPDRARARIFGPDPGYNFVLTGSAMMSYELLRQYACEDKTKLIREMVDEMFNGDDIAMNMISRYNGHRPIALTRNSPELEDPRDDQNKTGCLYDLGVNGRAGRRKIFKSKSISTRTGHAMKRQDMFMKFADHLGLSHDMSIHQDFYQPLPDVDLCTCATIPPAVMRGK